MNIRVGWLASMTAAATVLMGCSDGGGGGGDHFSTSVPPSTMLNALSASQQQELCGDAQRFVTGLEPDVCKEGAVIAAALESTSATTDSQLQMACSTAYNQCVGADSGATGSCDFSNFDSTCMATVGDLAACANDDVSVLDQQAAAFPSCSSLTRQNLPAAATDGGTTTTTPASCTALMNKCPSAFSSSSTGVPVMM